MATVTYLIRSSKTGKTAPVYLRFRDRNVNLMVKTRFKVLPEYWSNKIHSLKNSRTYTDRFSEKEQNDFKNDLQKLKDFIFNRLMVLTSENKEPSQDWLKGVIYAFDNEGKPLIQNKVTLNNFIEQFISDIETGARLVTTKPHEGERYKPLTIKNFKNFKVLFVEYQDKRRRKINFDDITADFYADFVKYCNDKNYSLNTTGRHIKNLKTIMRAAYNEGHHTNLSVNLNTFKTLRADVDNIYLSEKELQALYKMKLKGIEEVSRDVFLIGCYTAQRFSDYSAIRESNIRTLENGSKVIDLIQKKTGERVIIPIRPELTELLEKYRWNVPHIWEQKLNLHIKDVGQKAAITEPVTVERVQGGLKVKSTIPKHELIKTHTARRSGCTNMYLAGIPTIDIMKISGHKTEREFLKYIKVGKEETAKTLSIHPYFTGSHLKVVEK